jgi:(p)ppGpp synthase/HD superfamily hydrolase
MTPADKLRDWIKKKHAGQKIKRTDDPYFDHLLAVAEVAAPFARFGYEIGLCHDLFEKTQVTIAELLEAIIDFGYDRRAAEEIIRHVLELTDVFTAEAYPQLKKSARKDKEASRLLTISSTSQTVKYADLIYNIGWVKQYDKKDASKYLKKKRLLLSKMSRGNPSLRNLALQLIDN